MQLTQEAKDGVKAASLAITQATLALGGALRASGVYELTIQETFEGEGFTDIGIILSAALALNAINEDLNGVYR